jgi:hypothetical protein
MIMLSPLLLLATTAPDTMISGNWIIAVIGALATAGALLIGKVQGRKEATNNITLQSPVPELSTRKVLTPPSWDAHRALCDRVTKLEETTTELRRDLAGQYRELMVAGGEREERLGEKLDGIARGIHHRIDEMLNHKSTRAR